MGQPIHKMHGVTFPTATKSESKFLSMETESFQKIGFYAWTLTNNATGDPTTTSHLPLYNDMTTTEHGGYLCEGSLLFGDDGNIDTEKECGNALKMLKLKKGKTFDGVERNDFELNMRFDSHNSEFPNGCSWTKDEHNRFQHGIWNPVKKINTTTAPPQSPSWFSSNGGPQESDDWLLVKRSRTLKFQHFFSICKNKCQGTFVSPTMKQFHSTGAHCRTPLYIVTTTTRALPCNHRISRCERCPSGKFTGHKQGSSQCRSCPLGKSSGTCLTCDGLSWEDGGVDFSDVKGIKLRATKNDVVNCTFFFFIIFLTFFLVFCVSEYIFFLSCPW